MRNAFSGYTYQQQITLLLISMMDVERNISTVEIEAKTKDNFDDLVVTVNSNNYQFQIKDFAQISLKDLSIKEDAIVLKGNLHKLSPYENILFFKSIEITPTEKILGFPCCKLSDKVYVVSMNRLDVDKRLDKLYLNNPIRKNEIDSFFKSMLDRRIWRITIESLPQLKTFLTELEEKSIYITHQILQFEKLLLIEGKPGVGKSHFVNTLTKEYKNSIIYRFWIGNQDRDYEERLKFSRFLADLNTKLFQDQKRRTKDELFNKLKKEEKTFIIDGLDHVENYQKTELNSFINFINEASNYCKIIVLSRPLTYETNWNKHILNNWNLRQSEKVLKELFHLSEYQVIDKIYKTSQGYPIVIKFLAEHFKIHGIVPNIEEIKDIDSYYRGIIANEKGKKNLSLFLCVNSYLMMSEIELFVGNEVKEYIEEFIKEHPYLFDIKINRISLVHDSFNTFLRKQIEYSQKKEKVNNIVTSSLLNLEKRFLSRFGYFQLSIEQKKNVFVKYASIKTFQQVLENTIDFESIQAFYIQLRGALKDIKFNEISVNGYYDFSLILNLVTRNHVSAMNTFYYTYVQSLIFHGIGDDEITSSEYLFGMWYYVKTKNSSLLLNTTASHHYDTNNFHERLEDDVYEEQTYITKHHALFSKSYIDKLLERHFHPNSQITLIIENFFIHKEAVAGYEVLKSCFEEYLNNNQNKAIWILEEFISKYNIRDFYARWILSDVIKNLLSYGYEVGDESNEYKDSSLKELILKYKKFGSFTLFDKIHKFIRLALLEERTIDIKSIHLFWTKFYERKDYTVYGLPIALYTLESAKLISLKSCIELICEVQELSEKGHRHLLSEFIELYPATRIITFVESNFDIDVLSVDWFKLSTKYINKISERLYNLQENRLLKYHHSSLSIPLDEVKNVLYSNKLKRLESTLDLFRAKISFTNTEIKIIEKFSSTKIRFEELKDPNDTDKYKQNSQQHYDSGILTIKDIALIKKKKLKSYEIANYSDGYYTTLSDIKLYKIYEPEKIKNDFKRILYNSLISKTNSVNYFHSLFFHPGSVLAMIKRYRSEKEFEKALISFKKFVELSMFELKLN